MSEQEVGEMLTLHQDLANNGQQAAADSLLHQTAIFILSVIGTLRGTVQ